MPMNQNVAVENRPIEFKPNLLLIAGIGALGLLATCLMLTDSYVPAVAIAGIVGVCAVGWTAVYTFKHHEWVVLPIVLIFAVIAFSIFGDTMRAPIHYGLLALFCVPLIPAALRSGILREGCFRLYVYYLGFAALTIVYSIAPAFSLARLIEATTVMLALATLASALNDASDADRLLSHYFVGCVIVTAVMVFSLVLPRSLTWISPDASFDPDVLKQMHSMGISVDGIERFQSLFSGPNDVGAIMLVTIAVGLGRWPRTKGLERALTVAVMASTIVCAALADSRSPFVALLIGGVLFAVWRYRFRGLLWLGGSSLGILAVLAASGHDFSAYLDRGDVTTLTGRTDMWMFVLHSIAEHPILGYGYEVGGAIFDNRFFPLWWGPWDQGPHVSVHNGYLAHAVGVGIPVTLFWLYVMLRPWVFIIRRRIDDWDLKRFFFLAVIPILIHNMSEVMADDATGTVGFLFGLLWIIAERDRLLVCARERVQVAEARAALPRAIAALMPSR
jgi:O-antigen ligase